MKYSPLVMIKIKHSFYDRGECPDFSVSASAQTARLLNNHRCIVKPNVYGLTVYVPVDNQQPLIRFGDTSQLSFDLKLQTNEFALYTGQRLELSNPSGLQLVQQGLNVNLKQGIGTTPDANEPLLSVAIQRDFNQIMATPETDEIRFFAKPVLWFYYLVTDQSNSDQFTIVDAGQDLPKTTWQRQLLPDDGIYAQLVQQYPSMNIVCFVSEQTMDCRESCTRHLQLKQGEHTIFEQLPGPGYRNHFRAETKTGSKPTDAIYEIVKYLTNTTLIKG
ncbi:MAG: hypothetical protein ACXWT1_06220 [Methylobacter sp.]